MRGLWRLFFPSAVATRCPLCGAKVYVSEIRAEEFPCPSCKQLLCEAPERGRVVAAISTLVAIGVVGWIWVILSPPGWTLMFFAPAVFLVWVPILAVAGYVTTVLFPPKLLRYQRDRGLSLFGRHE